MPMNLMIAKVTPELGAKLLRQGPRAIRALLARAPRAGFDPSRDLLMDFDDQDLAEWAGNPGHPAAQLFEGWTFEDHAFAHRVPVYFGPQEVAALHAKLPASEDWVVDEIVSFIEQAARERKALIVGVA